MKNNNLFIFFLVFIFMTLEENFEEKKEESILAKIATGAICVVAGAAIIALLYFGVKYVCDNYLSEQKLKQVVPYRR